MHSFRPGPSLLLLLAAAWGLQSTASADSIWNVTTGDWNTAGNWSPSGVPTSSTDVWIARTVTTATVNIQSANAVSAVSTISATASTFGTVNVMNGWNWTNTNLATGNGVLNIQDGGTVNSASGTMGSGTVTVTGAGSQWTITNQLLVALSGTASMSVLSGGSGSSKSTDLGYNAGGNGTLTIDGVGSQWTTTSTFSIGHSGTGTIYVQSGGILNSTAGSPLIGDLSGSTGTVTVTGAGSQWTLATSVTAGSDGAGTLTVDAGGMVTAPNAVTLAYSNGSTGTLNLNGTAGSRGVVATDHVIEGHAIEGNGAGEGSINFNGGILQARATQSNFLQNFETGDVQILSGGAFVDSQTFNIGISTALQGAGGLTKQGTGTLTLSGASTYAGPTTLEGGTLSITGSLTSDVTAQSSATLGGTGTVKTVTVESGGKISPGVGTGMGTLNTLGETWNGGGTYAWNVNARPSSGTAGANWDFISLTGSLNIAATSSNKFTIDINGSVTGIIDFSLLDWTILTASTGFGGTFAANDFTLDTTDFTSNTGGTFSILTQGNNLVLHFVATPEPGRTLLLAIGAAALLLRRRRSLCALQCVQENVSGTTR